METSRTTSPEENGDPRGHHLPGGTVEVRASTRGGDSGQSLFTASAQPVRREPQGLGGTRALL